MENEYFNEVGENGTNIVSNGEEIENTVIETTEFLEEQSKETENMVDNSNTNSMVDTEITSSVLIDETQYNYISENLKIICHTDLIISIFLLAILVYLFISRMVERRKV